MITVTSHNLDVPQRPLTRILGPTTIASCIYMSPSYQSNEFVVFDKLSLCTRPGENFKITPSFIATD
jgi:hypothetical protein